MCRITICKIYQISRQKEIANNGLDVGNNLSHIYLFNENKWKTFIFYRIIITKKKCNAVLSAKSWHTLVFTLLFL